MYQQTIFRVWRRCFACLILVLSSLPLSAATNLAWFLRAWQTEDGLPEHTIVGLEQKPDGVLTFQSPVPGAGDSATLSARELEILELLSKGRVSKEIADTLSISYHTVRVHTKHIYEKLHVRSRSEAVVKFMADKSRPAAGRQTKSTL